MTTLVSNSPQRSVVLVKRVWPAAKQARTLTGSGAADGIARPSPGSRWRKRAITEAWEECGYHLAPFDLINNRGCTDNLDVPKTLGVIFDVGWFLNRVAPEVQW
ncbi:hypothetical protein J1605_004856 [Eschrichtius robustus]|uniref:Uncharacterized protein n=1 Tax=Eschrichtius robustus TaxID=9764 RepID=A0AB34HGA4_ESCRO|nr:hypothetical protein J1605_004856 [Eschrichtius robustus]